MMLFINHSLKKKNLKILKMQLMQKEYSFMVFS